MKKGRNSSEGEFYEETTVRIDEKSKKNEKSFPQLKSVCLPSRKSSFFSLFRQGFSMRGLRGEFQTLGSREGNLRRQGRESRVGEFEK